MYSITKPLAPVKLYSQHQHVHYAESAIRAGVISASDFNNLKSFDACLLKGIRIKPDVMEKCSAIQQKIEVHALLSDRIEREEVLTSVVASALGVSKYKITMYQVTDATKFSFKNDADGKTYEGEYKISEDGIEVNFAPVDLH